ncbi:DUF6931 family protein [Roseisolibacter agri]|uniref:Uncharacterized protein n=1 Tax=Roseisolibacter agri TaxID=2014610 RepID=A0AA37QET1_9BACT|nr:hypothetical protein [Roseisolibacter agri]GLC25020.1 hypothetical protein rosag_15330 [Roseisolibacter agri]
MTAPPTTQPLAPPGPPAGVAPLAPALEWLVQRAALDEEARALGAAALPAAFAPHAADPGLAVQALLQAQRPADALRLVACALPPREGVWWAWVAARHALHAAQGRADAARSAPPPGPDEPPAGPPPAPPTPAQVAALSATERWIAQPSDENRRFAWELAQQAGLDTPVGSAAAAAFFTGGSITPPGVPFVPPPAGLHATMAATAAMLAAVMTDPMRIGEVSAALVQQGLELVRRLGGWDAAIGTAKQTFDQQAYVHAESSKPPQLPDAKA